MCDCFRRTKSDSDTTNGLKLVRSRSKQVRQRNWETRNKFRCLFCGGASCKHENYLNHENPAIHGLNSDWITENVLATQRLSSRIIKEHNIISQFKSNNITSVFNLQIPGEHPYCGDGLQQNFAFTYTPEELYEANIYFYNMGWPDMHTPGINKMADLVQLMSLPIDRGEKIAVHCHAGYGRTGLAIACFLLYSTELNATQVIDLVRSKRPKCIQTSKQQAFVHEFHAYLSRIRELFPEETLSLVEYYSNQAILMHGNNFKAIEHIPRLVYEVCKKIKQGMELGVYMPEQVSMAFYDLERPVFTNPTYMRLLGFIQNTEMVVSVDETAMNSPVGTILDQVEGKIRGFKYQLNSWRWDEFLAEKDVRVFVQILLDWLEKFVAEPILMDPRSVDVLDEWIEKAEFKYTPEIKQYVQRVQFKLIECIVQNILYPLLGSRDFLQVTIRVTVCLLGLRVKWQESFEGRKMKKVLLGDSDVYEKKLCDILIKWAESLRN